MCNLCFEVHSGRLQCDISRSKFEKFKMVYHSGNKYAAKIVRFQFSLRHMAVIIAKLVTKQLIQYCLTMLLVLLNALMELNWYNLLLVLRTVI